MVVAPNPLGPVMISRAPPAPAFAAYRPKLRNLSRSLLPTVLHLAKTFYFCHFELPDGGNSEFLLISAKFGQKMRPKAPLLTYKKLQKCQF